MCLASSYQQLNYYYLHSRLFTIYIISMHWAVQWTHNTIAKYREKKQIEKVALKTAAKMYKMEIDYTKDSLFSHLLYKIRYFLHFAMLIYSFSHITSISTCHFDISMRLWASASIFTVIVNQYLFSDIHTNARFFCGEPLETPERCLLAVSKASKYTQKERDRQKSASIKTNFIKEISRCRHGEHSVENANKTSV